MGARDDLIALYWTTSGPVEVHFGREWSLYSLRERCEQARARRLPGHRPLACRHRAPARDADARRAARDPRRIRARPARARVPGRLVPRPRRRAARRRRQDACAALRGGLCAAGAPHQGRQYRGHGVRARPDRRGLRRALRRCGEGHRREDRLRVHAVRRPGERRRHGARGRRGRGRAERRPRVRHVAPRQDAARAGGAPAHPAALHLAGSSSPTAPTSTRRTGSTR